MGSNARKLWSAFLAKGGSAPAAGTVVSAPKVSAARAAVRASVPNPTVAGVFTGRVLGIDPSLRGTGLAVVEFLPDGRRQLLFSRTLKLKASIPFTEALGLIHRAVREALSEHGPKHVAAEETIYVQNFRTAQILGAARGAALSGPSAGGYPIFEYAPRRVKMAVVGTGAASKEQVARTVRTLVGAAAVLAPDEADAAAVALCHGFTWRGPS